MSHSSIRSRIPWGKRDGGEEAGLVWILGYLCIDLLRGCRAVRNREPQEWSEKCFSNFFRTTGFGSEEEMVGIWDHFHLVLGVASFTQGFSVGEGCLERIQLPVLASENRQHGDLCLAEDRRPDSTRFHLRSG